MGAVLAERAWSQWPNRTGEALRIVHAMDPPPAADDRTAAYAENLLGGCLAEQGRFAKAEPLLLGSLSGLRRPPTSVRCATSPWPWSGSFAFMSSGAGLRRQARAAAPSGWIGPFQSTAW